ncbi:hypothetical protein FC80_GL001711 [Liquorilactobacillus cacaonum DSM 21116]|uniref:Uncharacterized protein n=1 Tax=Liquorilactobacillus cacaonum DSM 21116 TaxID=1423729 RepID=A0A0R2CDR6_9LACO|nr:hypothetical protein FC80_GL001711 [Liquorilactobacillus cacaonum DSM 21116]
MLLRNVATLTGTDVKEEVSKEVELELAALELAALELAALELAALELAALELATLELAALELAALELVTLLFAEVVSVFVVILLEETESDETAELVELAIFWETVVSAFALKIGSDADPSKKPVPTYEAVLLILLMCLICSKYF